MKSLSVILCAATLAVGLPALAMQPPAAPAAPKVAAPAAPKAAPGKILTLDSTVGELIANPKTDAVLKALIPKTRSNGEFDTEGATLSMKAIAQYEPELTEAKLKEIGEALAKAQAAP